MPLSGRILKFNIKFEKRRTSSSRDAPARKDAVVTGVTKRELYCGPGCECQGCLNIPLQLPVISSTNNKSDSKDSSSTFNGTSSNETDDVETTETEVVTMEELIFN